MISFVLILITPILSIFLKAARYFWATIAVHNARNANYLIIVIKAQAEAFISIQLKNLPLYLVPARPIHVNAN
ncbi:hypothetical protein APT63_08925 [Pseudomonas sp. 22-AL-CL-001]|nr:hypothetical protein APT63_08925 [Pseudomonas monteilii]